MIPIFMQSHSGEGGLSMRKPAITEHISILAATEFYPVPR